MDVDSVIKNFIYEMNFKELRSFGNILQVLSKFKDYVKENVVDSK